MSAAYQRRGPALRVVQAENEIGALRVNQHSPKLVV
jgi:hypothetical protein